MTWRTLSTLHTLALLSRSERRERTRHLTLRPHFYAEVARKGAKKK